MLFKSELKAIPCRKAPKRISNGKTWVGSQIVELPRSGRVLAVDFITATGLRWRWFCDGKNYITWDEYESKFFSGYPGISAYSSSGYIEDSKLDEDLEMIGDCCGSGTYKISSFIFGKNHTVRENVWKKKYDLMEVHFAMYPDYPADLEQYCEDNIFDHGYIFFGKKGKHGTHRCTCSHCGKQYDMSDKLVSGREMACPECGNPSVLRGDWMKKSLTDKSSICIAQKVDGQLLLRWTNVRRTIEAPRELPVYDFEDFAYNMHLHVGQKEIMYSYKYFAAPYSYFADWHRLKNFETCFTETYVYTENMDEVFGSSYLNVDLKRGLSGRKMKVSFGVLLNALQEYPKAEYLFKLGLPALAARAGSITGIPTAKGTFHREMGVSKQYLPMYRDMNITMTEHIMIRNQRDWVSRDLMQRFRDLRIKEMHMAMEILDYDMTLSRFVSYFTAQKKRHQKKSMGLLMTEYQDYLRLSAEMSVDLSHKSVRYPQDIREAHKVVVERYNSVRNELALKKAEAVNENFRIRAAKRYEELGLGEYQHGDFRIEYPKLRTDLIREGQSLNHCVGGDTYYRRHMEGHWMIFFVRKQDEPQKPFFTMELDVDTGKILQLYGFGDCSAPKEVRSFAEGFAAYTQRQKVRKTA